MPSILDPRLLLRLSQSCLELNNHRPLNNALVSKIRQELSIEMTYHSNAIEGNRLTLKETFLVLREGITIKGKNLQEHLEAKNHQEAMNFLFELIDSQKKLTLSHHLIRQLHHLVVYDVQGSRAGCYRHGDVQILGSNHQPPPGYEVQQEMSNFLKWLNKSSTKYHPVEFAAIAHHRFVSIHPFEDGNGRAGRLLMNLLLMRQGFPLAIIQKNDRQKYYQALEKADNGDDQFIVKVVAQAVERVLNIYLKAIKKSSKKTEFIPLSLLAPQTSYSAKYLGLLSQKGLLRAHKKGRSWYSCLEAVEEYQQSRNRQRN